MFVSVGWSIVPCMLQGARADSGRKAWVRGVLTERSTERRKQLKLEGRGMSTSGRAEGEGYRGFHADGYGYNSGNHWPRVNRDR